MSNTTGPDGRPPQEELMFAIDFDSIFVQVIQFEKEHKIADEAVWEIYLADGDTRRLKELIYFFIKTTYIVVVPNTDVPNDELEQFLQGRKKAHEAFLFSACRIVYGLQHGLLQIEPQWADFYIEPIRKRYEEKHSFTVPIDLQVTLQPYLSARAKGQSTIEISAFSRDLLRQLNFMVWNMLFLYGSGQLVMKDLMTVERSDLQMLGRYLLPYFLFTSNSLWVARLPESTACSTGHIQAVLRTTMIQTQFIVAHEFAHLHLKHTETKSASREERLEREFEADQVAIELVLDAGEHKSEDIWTALRWLFQYQVMDSVVSDLVRDQDPDWNDNIFELRKSKMYSYFPMKEVSQIESLYEARGQLMLMKLKHRWVELGSEWMKNVAGKMRTRPTEVVPWWEEL